jgi:transcriptional regulator with PAS, ATPase and Fis domain
VLINSNPVYLNEKIIGAVVSETNITSQVRLHNELSNTTEKLFNLEKEVNKLLPSEDPFTPIKGNSSTLKQTINMAKKAAMTSTNILIQGESGVGKELFAKAVHNIREGQNAPFIAINCGAIPPALFESEIFGYEKGAFSGADQKGKKGKVELAKDGTLFLDEIGEMPLEMQVKILRLLQEKKFFSVGGTKEKEVDFRVIAATNRDLKEFVKEGKFREDLYYRLNVVSLEIPALRKRPEDIIELTHYFLYEMSIKYNRPIHGISQAVMQALLQHHWPGNIRELKNVVERLVVFSEDGEIKPEHLPFETDGITPVTNGNNAYFIDDNDNRSLSDRLQEIEKEVIVKELEKEGGNKLACAKKLQITRATLYNRINKLGLDL